MNPLLKDILPYDLFKRMLDEGYIRSQVHPQYPELVILNYTEAAQFGRMWNEATNVCRGLIVRIDEQLTGDAEVQARPFNKFHNLNTEYIPETLETNLPPETPLVTTKLDGSMGVFYAYDGKLWIATRGSFDSDQARWATEWFRQQLRNQHHPCGYLDKYWDFTPVFEIIYAVNRIVVDYDFEGLVLLGLVDKTTGLDRSRAEVEEFAEVNGFKVVPKFNKTLAECAAENTLNEEGYVLTYSNGVKVKVKFLEYCRLHRLVTGLNPKSVWEMLSSGQDEAIAALLSDSKMPEGFKTWFSDWMAQLKIQFVEIKTEALVVFANRPDGGTRKEHALYFQKAAKHLSSILFAMLDGEGYDEIIWDRIAPKGNQTLQTFKKEGE